MATLLLLLGLWPGQDDAAPAEPADRPAATETNAESGDRSDNRTDAKTDAEPDAPPAPADELSASLGELASRVGVDEQLTEQERTDATGWLDEATAAIESARRFREKQRLLQSRLASAPDEVARLEAQLSEPLAPLPLPPATGIAQWQAELARLESQLAQSRLQRSSLLAQIEARRERRTTIPQQLEEAQIELARIEGQLETARQADGTLATQVRRDALRARQLSVQAEIETLRQELRTYEATARLDVLQVDQLARQVRQFETLVDAVRDRLQNLREQLAEERLSQLVDRADAVPDALRAAAVFNVHLARENLTIVRDLAVVEEQLEEGQKLRDRLVRDFAILQERAAQEEISSAVGASLRSYRTRLLAARARADQIARLDRFDSLGEAVEAIRSQLLSYEDQKSALLTETAATEAERELLATRRLLLLDLIDHGRSLLDNLTAIAGLRRSLRAAIDVQARETSEQLLWVRSAPPLRLATLAEAGRSVARIARSGEFPAATAALAADSLANPVWLVLAILLLGCSLLARRKLLQILKACCEAARRPTIVEVRPTIVAFLASAALALLVPAILWILGWRLEAAAQLGQLNQLNQPGQLGQAIGIALQQVALVAVAVEFVRIVSRPHGLGNSHFCWPEEATGSVRRILWTLILTALPAMFVTVVLRNYGDVDARDSLGRVAFLVAAAAFAVGGWQLFRRRSPVMAAARERSDRSLFARTRWLWAMLAIGTPVVLGVMTTEGHFYAAQQFAMRALLTAVGLTAILLVQAMLNRILLVTYRRLAMRRAKEKRAERQAQQEALGEEENEPSDLITAESDEPEVTLTEVSDQNRKLIRIATIVAVGLTAWLVWSDVLPAFEWLAEVEVYDDHLARELGLPADATTNDANVTLLDLLLFAIVAVLTFVAARNLPGLLEIAVLQRVPLDAGARYAAAAVARYLIATLGIILAFRIIGIGWSSVQWLVAAVSVGLGFGLQEIFANFVSGLILLFERPIRVGDTVTINDITGTVTRIRIRATTVLDWDNREMILPNKDFVTGNLINWTLSNPNVRVVQTIGIAYGSNTELATELLKGVAESSPRILDEPSPLVVFTEFGDNSLIFELRFFVTGLQAFRTVKHELNMQIERLFREAEIEISFPQRDLHLRSIDPDVRDAIKGGGFEAFAG